MSPYKSEAQRRKMHELAKEGKIKKEVVRKLDDETGDQKLPEHAKDKESSDPNAVIHDVMQVLNQ